MIAECGYCELTRPAVVTAKTVLAEIDYMHKG